MSKTVSSISARRTTPDSRFSLRDFRRLVLVASQRRSMLALGVLATVVFACLHTVSIGTAFPVFKILLEKEGVRGWTDRTVAGWRLGVQFALPSASDVLVVKVDSDGAGAAGGLRPGDRLLDPAGRPAAQWLAHLASAPAGTPVSVLVRGSGEAPGKESTRHLRPAEPDMAVQAMRWAAARVPGVASEDRLRTLQYLLGGLVVVVVVANLFRYLGEVLIVKAVLQAMITLRGRLFEHTLHLPMSFFSGTGTADLVGRFVQDIQEIQRGMLTLFSKFIREPLRAVFVLAFAFTLDWRMTLTLLVVAPITGLIFWRVGQRVKRSNKKLLQAYGEMIDALTASLQNLGVVKAYTAETHERDRLRRVDSRVLRQQVKLAKLQAFVSPAMETVVVFAACLLTLWLAGRVLSHQMSMARFATLGVAMTMLFDPLRKLTDVYVRVQRSTAGAERIFQVLDHPIESDTPSAHIELGPLKDKIEMEGVSFTYPGADTPALDRVDFEIRRGETVALVGPNGCGKTTLVSMLPRLFSPDAGRIRYDGVDLRDATLESLRTQIGIVSQEAAVFAGTPAENIVYGSRVEDNGRVRHAARRASADAFIRAIPGGYDGIVGERGSTLSGGQRQRLAIARAIFRDAPILIFDEATSQVDAESELKIQQALRAFAKGRTTIIIAHRLSTIQFADRIVVMDAGRIIDSGSRKELFDRCRLFRTLCETQFGADSLSD